MICLGVRFFEISMPSWRLLVFLNLRIQPFFSLNFAFPPFTLSIDCSIDNIYNLIFEFDYIGFF